MRAELDAERPAPRGRAGPGQADHRQLSRRPVRDISTCPTTRTAMPTTRPPVRWPSPGSCGSSAATSAEVPPPKFKRLNPGQRGPPDGRLPGASCTGVDKDEAGNVVAVHANADLETGNGNPADGRKVRGTIHWVSCAHCHRRRGAPVRQAVHRGQHEQHPRRRRLQGLPEPRQRDHRAASAKLEESLKDAKPGDRFQFVRNGYFTPDSKHAGVYNRIVTLKDSFKV